MTTFRALKQYIEDLESGLALRFDALGERLGAIENDIAAIKDRLGERSSVDPHVVASHTGLTPAQSRVAALLADGNTVHDIVLKTGAKENSVRAHIKRIHSKLGVSTQAQLVRIVLLLPPVGAGYEASSGPLVPHRRAVPHGAVGLAAATGDAQAAQE